MLTGIKAALIARFRAMLEAEVLVLRYGSRGAVMAQSFANDLPENASRREHFRRVAAVEEQRHDWLRSLDVSCRYEEIAKWRNRPDALIRSNV